LILDEALILVRHQMPCTCATVSMVTLTTISSDVPPNRTARRIGYQEFGYQADDGEIDRADHRDARQHVVDVFRRALARADAGNEAAMLLQVVGRLRRIEHDRRVEEGEEDDQLA
jgi:hypothetical protein